MSSTRHSDADAVVRHRLRGALLDLCYEHGYQSVDLDVLLARYFGPHDPKEDCCRARPGAKPRSRPL